ncbi:MAG: phosphoenolpyruvate--protein phosphotransferase [Rhodospirillaceae bacterium]|nr:phosphoenolpyruvate--protein phosphotransferase [Rhodospirillaceae bacterium]
MRCAPWSATNSTKSRLPLKTKGDGHGGERIFEGFAVGAGIAIGVVHRHDSRAVVQVRERHVPANRIRAEQSRIVQAAYDASRRMEELQAQARRMKGAAGEELGYLLDAYHQMLSGSRLVRGVQARISEQQINAEAAVMKEIGLMAEAFAAMDDPYLAARIADIREVGRRLVESLGEKTPTGFEDLPDDAVLVADELSPADTALLDPKKVAGLATMVGGVESHTAIVARALGLPAVVAADFLDQVENGETAIIDGGEGKLIVAPSAATLNLYRERRADFLRAQRALTKLKTVPATTRDGMRVTLQANIELPSEVDAVLASGAEGIGLLRSEFLFMNRGKLPTEEEQFKELAGIVRRMQGRPVTIRTLDVGADKLGDALDLKTGPNPALGLRAIRFSLSRRKLLLTQLSAILRVSALGPVRILLPMVCTVEEVREVRRILARLVAALKRKGVKMADPPPPLGVMIEIPGAALAADALAAESDFFAIGTNDLTQYTLAIDRTDEQVAYLYNPLHPAVLRLIQFAAEAAHAGRIPVSVCGEMAGDERLAPLLLGFGITELSMSPANLPRVKNRILDLTYSALQGKVRRITSLADPAKVRKVVDELSS